MAIQIWKKKRRGARFFKGPAGLSALMAGLEKDLSACMRCGVCQSACPLFRQTRREADVARGKLALLEGLAGHLFRDSRGVDERLDRCLLCGSCQAVCAGGVHVLAIFLKARAILAGYRRLSFVKKIIFRTMLARPGVFDKITAAAAKFQGVFLTGEDPETGSVSFKIPRSLSSQGRRIPPPARTPLRDSLPDLTRNPDNPGPRAVFFTGCLIDKIYPRVGHAAIQALLSREAAVLVPKNQGCCGIPALAAGEIGVFSDLVAHHVRLFSKQEFDFLITACATCAFAIQKLWPAMWPETDPEFRKRLERLSEKTLDISQFLVNVAGLEAPAGQGGGIRKKESAGQKIVTYHDPCHLAKSLGVRREPRELLRACPGYEFREMAAPDQCCGMGGSFNLSHYGLSSRIGAEKAEHIEAAECHVAASGCPACMIQISDMLSGKKAPDGSPIRVAHPVELYAEGLKD